MEGIQSGHQILQPVQVQQRPIKIESEKWESKSLYTLILSDPDAPNRKEHQYREWMHWVVVNVPVKENTNELDVAKGEHVVEYIGAGPPQDSGLHRYVFLAVEQPQGKIEFQDAKLKNTSGENRGGWKVRDVLQKHNLGKVTALACFEAEWDEAVRGLYDRLGKGIPADKVM